MKAQSPAPDVAGVKPVSVQNQPGYTAEQPLEEFDDLQFFFRTWPRFKDLSR